MNVLTLSDKVVDRIYNASIIEQFKYIDLIIGCGDLPYYYLEFVKDALNSPLFFVRGNHSSLVEYGVTGSKSAPQGGVDLHRQVVNHKGLLLAGLEGSVRYKPGPFMYTQAEMWSNVISLLPRLIVNLIEHGRYLDVLVTHAPPWGIHDREDFAHQGFKAIRWFVTVFKPAYHFHGHIHLYDGNEASETQFRHTLVINTYGYKEVDHQLITKTRTSKSPPLGSSKV